MVTILMVSVKMGTPGLHKVRVFTTKFYHVIQIILQIWSRDQSLVTVAFLWEKLS